MAGRNQHAQTVESDAGGELVTVDPFSEEKVSGAARLLAGLATFAFISFGLVDIALTDTIGPLIWCRAICCLLLMVPLGLTWTRWGRQHAEWLGGLVCIITGCGVTVLTELTGGPHSPYWTMVMLTFFGVALVLPMARSRAILYFGVVAVFYPLWMLIHDRSLSDAAGVTSTAGIVLALCVSVVAVGYLHYWRLRDVEKTRELVTLNTKLRQEMAERTIAERRQRAMEGQIRESQKIDAVGQLASGMAHELNNVLTTIMCTADMMRTGHNDPNSFDASLARVLRAAERGSKLTTDLLGFARRGSRSRTVFSVNSTITEVVDLLARTHQGRASFELNLDPNLPAVTGDSYLLFQALVNLSLNAIQAMDDSGTVTIHTQSIPLTEAAPAGRVEIRVVDTGRGMTESERERAFEPFFTTKSADEGTGLGLSMVYGTTREFGGEVTLETTLGEGTTVIISLPGTDASPTPEHPKPTRTPQADGDRVLVVDDDELVRALVVELLEQVGFEVTCAADGLAGLEAYRAAENGFDLVVVDMVMPRLDGGELMRRILDKTPDQRALLISGYADQTVIGPLLENQRRHFLRKPFAPKTFLDAISSSMAPRESTTPPSDEGSASDTPHVLVVEDHAALRKLTRGALEAIGMTVTVVESGEKALDAYKACDFSIVLLDLRLPGWSGTETAKQMRSAFPNQETPIVGLSGRVEGNERDACLAAGMNGFLAKPFTIDQLKTTIEAHL